MDIKTRKAYDGFEAIELGKDGFEFDRGLFWFLADRMLGPVLAKNIEKKTIKLILEKSKNGYDALSEEELNTLSSGDEKTKQQVLSKLRRNFPNQRYIVEIFNIQTAGFNQFSPTLSHLCRNAANAPALDDGYNVTGSFEWNNKTLWPESKSTLDPFAWFWGKYHANFPSVRNRYRLVKYFFNKMGGGDTLSIASGSAQALIHATKEVLDDKKNISFNVTLTDTNTKSLELAMRRANDAGVSDYVTALDLPFEKLPIQLESKKFKIIEACGILDYLPEKHAIKLIQFALHAIQDDGLIIMSNMNNTNAGPLLSKLFNWDIIYRTPSEFGSLIKKAGGKNVKVYVEPWEIHPVVTFTK